jgi:GH15 family glucan-1,4-alpha-glucosidase
MSFLRDVAEAGPLQPLYGIDGRRDLPEITLENLAGFNGNDHVRIGNAAVKQRQNDLMGELVLCLDSMLADPRIVQTEQKPYFPLVQRLVEDAIRAAPTPDTSIWEFRTKMEKHTFSRAMCWAAIERGAAIARRFGETALADRWSAIADSEHAIILEHGFNAEKGFFTQEMDGEHADASLLLLPAIGFIDAKDPRFIKTIDAYAKILAPDGLMKRYVHHDDFGETTNTFTICSFWWAEALALAGRLDEAVEVFERVSKFANPLGLFSEDIDPKTGELLGNFPQAYTHVGLIHTAITIGELIAARDGKFRSWT